MEDPNEAELTLCRFRRLMAELKSGVIRRNHFESWEVEILLDLEKCRLSPRRWARALEKYSKAVERQLEKGTGPPIKPSQVLEHNAAGAPRMNRDACRR